MAEIRFKVDRRFASFWKRARSVRLHARALIIYSSGWLLTFGLLVSLFGEPTNVWLIPALLHGYFWFKLLDENQKHFRPPVEILVALFFVVLFLEIALLQSLYFSPYSIQTVFPSVTGIPKFVQILLVAFLALTFSAILVQNSGGKKSCVVGYALLAYIGIHLTRETNVVYLLIFQGCLFIFLLRKTSWLEELTRTECWLYLFAFYFLLRQIYRLNIFDDRALAQPSDLWFGLPYVLYLLFRTYLLAVLAKIPIVLIYNHARLSRKLWISGLFQSTFPQLIQLGMLLLIFYFFIAGWQAQRVREAIAGRLQEISSSQGQGEVAVERHVTVVAVSDTLLSFDNHVPFMYSRRLPDQGLLSLARTSKDRGSEQDHFMFKRSETRPDTLYLVRLDADFLKSLAEHLSLLAGSHLLAYPYQPRAWEDYIYRTAFFSENHNLRIFPFALIPQNAAHAFNVRLAEESVEKSGSHRRIGFTNQTRITIGRVLTPHLDEKGQRKGYFAFDVVLVPSAAFFRSPMFKYVLYLVVIYFIVNVFIIRRVVKFGSEINHMIVQKFKLLQKGIREISAGDLDYKVRLEGDDEFVELAERFNQMGDRLKETIEKVREKDRLEHELKIARQVQLSLLPRQLPRVSGFEIVASLRTANEVGGDFYDVLPLTDQKFLFTIGDVSGKGTSAAFYMAQCISLIRYSHQFTEDPTEMVLRLNNYFSDPLVDRQIFVTAILGVLDPQHHQMKWIRAGHNPPIFVPGDPEKEISEIKSAGLGIGLERAGPLFEKELKIVEMTVEPGDLLVFYTDGLVEAAHAMSQKSEDEFDEEIHFYGEQRLMNLLSETRGSPAGEVLNRLVRDIEDFYEDSPPVDDYTILILQRQINSGLT